MAVFFYPAVVAALWQQRGAPRDWLERHVQPGARYELIKRGYRMRFLKLVP